MRSTRIAGVNTIACELDCLRSHFGLRQRAASCRLLGRVAVAVARCEFHRRVNARRVLAQYRFDRTQLFNELAPVDCAQHPQTADAVADRNLV